MGAIGPWIVRTLTPVARWIGINVIIPWLAGKAKALVQYFKDRKAARARAETATQGNDNYENNPSDSSFGDSP